ncbi:MAG: M48 family metallopeptidase [Thiotrichaceae bacterium]|nr:M48 family metallopeptidase [Thiotrichaceae bacterium]
MQTFTLLFLIALLLSTSVQLWLSFRQMRHVAQNRSAVPEAFTDKISLEEHQKAAAYTVTKGRFGTIEMMIGTIVLLFWLFGGGLNWLDQKVIALGYGSIVTGVIVILVFSLISSIIDLPASLYKTFVIEEKFGFNKLTLKTLFIDTIKSTLLGVAIGAPFLALILWLMSSAGSLWWLYAWTALSSFSLLMMWAYPKFIAPIFNKFSPLEEGETLTIIKSLLTRSGFSSDGVFVMDGSRRSSHGNAYFTGFGKNKRIVFFDTLLKHLTPKQIEAVLAHELGHFKHKHVIKGLIVSLTTTLIGFAILAWLMQTSWFYSGLGVDNPSIYNALLLFMLAAPAFTFLLGPIMSWWSRKHEFEADSFAAKQSSATELISALVSLYKENASTLTPDPLYSSFYDSHPPASIRIAHLQKEGEKS